ncbi:LysR family transcriptional regulator [Yersinia frederiksenii]|uniref:LysR family transcriptional regulator n=1 Tax=Yersinia alsatica TaxID=2890317 RepID=A0ABY5UQD1_9GAMM|nr:LysR family transcriptional regulator [Yersinia alsatica]OWF67466.1 LysR family transcriptional regulator [Yersinia frederiksenii]OWF74446.1 LysR family transcriptional regulator [Yersinia frederiksenii]UWM44342.1 LysR family transcriptional regulator [Yersinia alsatica]CFQ42957.1 LysR family transcriptional regulator [Yersinia frederiksenii]CNH66615.1 LysR family transcriptional regulator [Yersinia frederiksenii]
MDSLSSLTVFVQVAESRSFVIAGRILGVSASAVGKSIARLETRLGVRLFHRSTRSITLTSEGALFLERSRRILAEVEAAELEMSQLTDKPRGRLRVSLPLVSTLLLPVLADFMLAYPDIELDLDFSDRIVDVVEEGFDAVVRTGELTDSRLSTRKLGQSVMLLVASPAYLEQHGEPLYPTDLAHHICLHYRFPNSGKLETWPLPNESDLRIPISMVCNNIETRLCFALRGLGIACLPDFSLGSALADGKLRVILNDAVKRRVDLHVVWPSGRFITPKLRVFIDFLSERMFAGKPQR